MMSSVESFPVALATLEKGMFEGVSIESEQCHGRDLEEAATTQSLLGTSSTQNQSEQRYNWPRGARFGAASCVAFACLCVAVACLVVKSRGNQHGLEGGVLLHDAIHPSMLAESTPVEGHCTNGHDLSIWENGGGKASFGKHMQTCGKSCWGARGCVTNCMVEKDSYSTGCADCFGGMAQCSASSCAMWCMFGGERCEQCVEKNCRPTMRSCTGLSD